jgi:long-chain-fatty-acid--CoA ligase ACSBG
VSYLPLSHVAANFLDIFVTMTTQSGVYFADKDALKGNLLTLHVSDW